MDEMKAAYRRLWALIDRAIWDDRIELTADEAEWFYCDQPAEYWR